MKPETTSAWNEKKKVETPRSMMKSIEENGIDHLPPVPVQQYWILFFLSEQNSMSNGDRKERNAINIIDASFFVILSILYSIFSIVQRKR